MCRKCDYYQVQLHLRREELLRTPVCRTKRLEKLCDWIDALEEDWLFHRCYGHGAFWQTWPEVEPLAFVERLN
jgi:hypothetical protein